MIIKAFITKAIYKNPENNYSIYKVALENGEEHTITGILPDLVENILYEFDVKEKIHPKYGLQFEVKSYKQAESQNKEGLISYLSSDLFFGVGVVKATRIVEHLGDNAIEKILEDKNVLREIGFNPLQTERFYRALYDNQQLDKILVELFSYGLTLNLSMKLFNFYSFSVVDVIKENPYQLIDDIENIGFLRADNIASKLGFKEDDPKRIEAAIVYSINEYINKTGHTYLSENGLYQAISKILNVNKLQEPINNALTTLINKGIIHRDNGAYTLLKIKQTEENLAKYLLSFLEEEKTNVDLTKLISEIEKTHNIDYTKQQKQAIIAAINNPLTVITGGPGTGKTTVIQGILSAYSFLNGYNMERETIADYVGICAPTGRAARRMSDLVGVPAFTIHKLLGYGYDRKFTYNEKNKLTQSLFVIDEASMIDIFLAEQLFKAIPRTAKVVIVGDKDQLPSVGPGQVLADIIESNRVPVIILDEIHRQALNSGIIKLANEVNKQEFIDKNLVSTDDLIFINQDSNKIVRDLIKLTDEALKNNYNLIDDLQVLIPMYKTAVGIDTVNQAFQEHFNGEKDVFIQRGANKYYIGDKVMHLVNSPDKGVMNGDIGQVTNIYETKDNEKILIVNYTEAEVVYRVADLDELTLAYAISIHKSQGSEYQIVFVPLLRNYSIMLRKELLYTAITRAKKFLYLIGDLSLIEYASRQLNKKRKTKLREYLKEEEITSVDDEEEPIIEELSPYDFM